MPILIVCIYAVILMAYTQRPPIVPVHAQYIELCEQNIVHST